MTMSLQQLAREGEISWLSYYFAEFISQRDDSPMDAWPVLSAALVSEANLAGNVCVDLEQFHDQPLFAVNRAGVDQLPLGLAPDAWAAALLASTCVGEPGETAPMILADSRLYLNRYWYYEQCVADIITAMLARQATNGAQQVDADLEARFTDSQDADSDQLVAVRNASNQSFSVISGGPGSGKTSTVIRILALLLARDPDYRIALAAPTGKAAARMMDSIRQRLEALPIDPAIRANLPLEALTLHRLLGYHHHSFTYNSEHRLPIDCVVIDEASMIDLKLMYQLLIALPEHAQLILLGDRDQLASVAAGNVLGDITGHGQQLETTAASIASATSLLRSSYRFGHDSAIGELAQKVRMGEAEPAIALLQSQASGLQWLEVSDSADSSDPIGGEALHWIQQAYQPIFDCATPSQALDIYEGSRLLCVTNRGPLGVEALNNRISSLLSAGSQQIDSGYFTGLPIMITRNLHELGLFNGDSGILWSIDGELRACFRADSGDIRDLAINRLSDFKPAWAITVHKSQGSEFDSVLLLLPAETQSELLSRELLYTGITRTRRNFLLQSSRTVLTRSIECITRRHSGLANKLGWPDIR